MDDVISIGVGQLGTARGPLKTDLVLNHAFLAGAVLACVTAAWPPVNRIQQSKCQLTEFLFQTEAPWFLNEMGVEAI